MTLIQPKDELSSETAIREFLLFLPSEIRLHVPFLTEKGLAICNKSIHLNQFQSVNQFHSDVLWGRHAVAVAAAAVAVVLCS